MPRAKLFFQIIMTVIAMCSGIMFVFSEYFWVNAAFTTLWVIGITNAINLLDNMDGASPGITFICVLSLALLPHHIEPELAQIAIALAGSLAGFLIFNSYPAKIFMGDSGSLFLGNLMALCLLDFSQNISPEIYHTIFHLPSALLIPTLMILTPIVDTTFVTINRKLNGYPISKGDRGHIAHRLSFLFGNDQLSVGLLYSFQLLVCVVIASYNWLLLYPIIGLLLVALRLLTLMTNHQVWPEKFETPQVTWFGWELPQFLSPFNQNEDLASQVQD